VGTAPGSCYRRRRHPKGLPFAAKRVPAHAGIRPASDPAAFGIVSMRPAPARAAAEWLADEGAFRALAARVDRLVALQSALAARFPKAPLSVVSLDAGTLTLRAPNAAWAARLRQSAPTMLQALRDYAAGIERIRIVTQRTGDGSAAPVRVPRAASPSTALHELDRLREVTDAPALEQALARLVRHHRGAR